MPSNNEGKIFHSIRFAAGNWLPFGDVTQQAGNPGAFWDVSIAGNETTAELHMIGRTGPPVPEPTNGKLWHTIRSADGKWVPFGDVLEQTGGPSAGIFSNIDISLITGNLHVAGTTTAGGVWHAIRASNGVWTPLGNVLGQIPGPGSPFIDISIAGNGVTGVLHVVALTEDGGIWHTIRRADGGWLAWGNVKAQRAGNPGVATDLGIALVGAELQVAVRTGDSKIWHTIRASDGSWLPFGDVTVQAGKPDQFFDVAAAGNNQTGEQQLVTGGLDSLWHTIRRADGTWFPFGDINAQAGNEGSIEAVAAALIGSDLHVATTPVIGIQ
jgi:hypothetical protein